MSGYLAAWTWVFAVFRNVHLPMGTLCTSGHSSVSRAQPAFLQAAPSAPPRRQAAGMIDGVCTLAGTPSPTEGPEDTCESGCCVPRLPGARRAFAKSDKEIDRTEDAAPDLIRDVRVRRKRSGHVYGMRDCIWHGTVCRSQAPLRKENPGKGPSLAFSGMGFSRIKMTGYQCNQANEGN